jgi:hypothetical protein
MGTRPGISMVYSRKAELVEKKSNLPTIKIRGAQTMEGAAME